MPPYTLLSSDSHLLEPADLWEQRIDPKFTDRAPRLVHEGIFDPWDAAGVKCGNHGTHQPAGVRCEAPEQRTAAGSLATMPLGGVDPHAHGQEMDLDAVAGGVRYPSQGLPLYRVVESQLLSAMVRASNDWLADCGAPSPQRLQGLARLHGDDVADALGAIPRVAKLGLAGAMMPRRPRDTRDDHPDYDPLGAAAPALALPFSLPVGTDRWGPGRTRATPSQAMVELAHREGEGRRALAARICGGVFERYPAVQGGAVACEIAWAPSCMDHLDNVYRERAQGVAQQRFPHGALPSDCLRQNAFISFQEDALGSQLRSSVGVEPLRWGADSPHAASTCPRSREIVDCILQGVPDEEKRKIVGENVARLDHFR